MKTILNHTLRSIKNNKGQISVIITTITVVTVMIFIALSTTGLFYNISMSTRSRLAEDMDIAMRGGEPFPKAKVESFVSTNSDKIEYADYFLQTGGLLQTEDKTKIIMLEATDFRSFYQRYPNKLIAKDVADSNFEYPAIWIGEDFADELNVKAGDTVKIFIEQNNRFEKMSISRVMENRGFFADTSMDNVLIDIHSINNWGMINLSHIKLTDSGDFSKVTESLKEYMRNDAITIESAIDYERIDEIVENNTRLLNIALIFIMTIMILILFTSYLIVAKNRLNEMIIFKAAGATPTQTVFIMLTEVLLYGFIGAALGLIIGRIGMGITVKAIIPSFPGAITYDLWKYIVAFLTGVGVSLISAIFPVLRVGKKSIRELTSGIVKDVKYTKPFIIVSITALLAISLVLLLLYELLILPLTVVLIVLFAMWIYFVIPYIIKFVSKLFSKIKGQSRLSSISIKRNSSTNTLTTLVAAVITFSFIVVTVISLIITAITPYNSRYDSDYVISSTKDMEYQKIINEMSDIEGVENAIYYRGAEFELYDGSDTPLLYNVVGISDEKGLEYATKGLNENDIDEFKNLQHPVVINYDMAERLDLREGDNFSASRLQSSANETYRQTLDYEFTVTGIDYTVSENDRVVYIKLEDMTYNGDEINFFEEMIFINAEKGADRVDLFLTMRDKLSREPSTYVLKFSDWAYAGVKGYEGVIILMRIIQFLVSFVAFIGVINLSIVTIKDRKRELTVYKASGLSSKKYILLSVYESLIISLSGGIIGIVLSFFFNTLMPAFASLINKYIVFNLFPVDIPVIAVVAVFVYIMIYTLIALSNKKAFLNLRNYNERGL